MALSIVKDSAGFQKAAKEGSVRGMDLLNELSAATGLPDELIGEELSRLISGTGKTSDDITLDELREMLGAYLQSVLLEAKHAFENDEVARAEIRSVAAAIEVDAAEPGGVVISMVEKFADKKTADETASPFTEFIDLAE